MNGITVCVDYWDFLAISLPRTRKHFDRYLIITTESDRYTREIARQFDCEVLLTDAFYKGGASFNKYLPLEMGLDILGREGWIAIIDADIIWPSHVPSYEMDPDCLYVPNRRYWETPQQGIPLEESWSRLPGKPWEEFAGYSQIFHASSPCLGPPPWHETNWRHAGGGDSFFQLKWPPHKKIRPPFEVLHLGEETRNWCGRATPFLTGEIPPNAQSHADQLQSFLSGRNRFPQEDMRRFAHEKL